LGFKVIEVDTGKNASLGLAMVSGIGPQPVLSKIILKMISDQIIFKIIEIIKIIFIF